MRWHARAALALGLYRPLRWLQRHVFGRKDLARVEGMRKFYSEQVSPGDLVFDVGANRGDMTDVFLQLGCRVVAFEPQEDMRRVIDARFGANPDLTLLEFALGSETGESKFFVNRGHTGASSMVEEWRTDFSEVVTVPVRTLDAMIDRFGLPRYIKIDVEGFEVEVLQGLSQCIPLISFEHTRDHPDGPEKVRKCIEQLGRHAKLQVNLTPAETLKFTLNQWIPASQFLELYPQAFAGFEHRYGDVFVKSVP